MEAGHPEPTTKRMSVGELGRPLMLSLAALAVEASAGEAARYTFDLPSQPLSASLNSVALTSGAKLVYADTTVKDRRAAALQGSYTVDEALNRLLAANDLHAEPVGGTVFAVKEAASAPSNALPKVTVTGKADYDPNDPYNDNYAVPNSKTATKTDTPIMETPVSIQAVSRTVMDDQQVVTLNDALKNISGVQVTDAFYDGAIIRGFDSEGNTYRNGLRQAYLSNMETANLSAVEVLKGPASVLYGRIQPGGMINLVPKRGFKDPYFSVQQQFGSYDFYRTTVDATGPLTSDKTLLGRMNIAYRSNNSFRDFVSQENVFVAPTVTWRPTDQFEVNLDVEYQHYQFTDDEGGLVAVGNRPADIPINRFLQDGNYTSKLHPNTQDKVLTALDWTYRFNEDWRITNRFQYTSTSYHQTSLWFGELNEATGVLKRGVWDTALRRNSYAANLDLVGKFFTGDFMRHETLVGFDFYRLDEHDGPGYTNGIYGGINEINIYDPQYSGTDLTRLLPPALDFAYENYENWYGVYFQDQITLWEKLHVLLGGRQDWASQSTGGSDNGSFAAINLESLSSNAFNPRFGLLYQATPWLSLYGNYVQSYGSANSGFSISGQPFSPQTGKQAEMGAKLESPDKRVTATLAFYQIYKDNLLAVDPQNPQYSRASGQARSRGFELDVSGRITENWGVTASYAYTDADYVKGDFEGNGLMGVAKNSGNVWTKYEFSEGDLKGLSFGTGVYARGQRQGDPENSFQLPGYVRWDASIGYSFVHAGAKITTQLNAYNLLDQTYYDRSSYRLGINAGAPLTFLGSVRVEY